MTLTLLGKKASDFLGVFQRATAAWEEDIFKARDSLDIANQQQAEEYSKFTEALGKFYDAWQGFLG